MDVDALNVTGDSRLPLKLDRNFLSSFLTVIFDSEKFVYLVLFEYVFESYKYDNTSNSISFVIILFSAILR